MDTCGESLPRVEFNLAIKPSSDVAIEVFLGLGLILLVVGLGVCDIRV